MHQMQCCKCTQQVKLGDKEHFDKKQIGVKELFTDYQPFYTIRNVPTYMVIGTYLQVY